MWDKIKNNLSSGSVYLKEYLFFDLLIILLILLLPLKLFLTILSVLLVILVTIIVMAMTGSRRRKEFDDVRGIIANIHSNVYTESWQIKLNKNLPALEEEIKKMFQTTKNDIEYLKKLEKMRTEFLANVSHELRTPIFAIQGYIETLLNGAMSDPNVNYSFLEKANRHTLNLNSLLNDLIDISMIETGEMRLSFRYFNINDFIEQVVTDFKSMANDKNLELVYHPAKEGLLLYGDKNKLRQVFSNLIENAVKYTDKGKVEILVQEEKSYAAITVKDTGIGIPEADIGRVFERFYRVDKARSKDIGGTGLGLAIVKHIIEAHGSKIEVSSIPGQGSEFSFKLKK